MRDLQELNLNVGGERVRRPPPSSEDIDRFEATFKVRLPREYVALLSFSNGGQPEMDTFPVAGVPDDISSIETFCFLSNKERDDFANLWHATPAYRVAIGANVVPIGFDAGGNVIFLDYRSEQPDIWLWLHNATPNLFRVCDSFEVFVDLLHMNPDYI